jgi:hypothetical protein
MIPPRLSYANVVSTLALFGVIAGGSAAALPGKKTVQADDLKKNSVKAAAVKNNAIRGAEIKDGAVESADVADEALTYGDLGSNSVVARIRSTGPVQSGDGGEANPVDVPLSGDQWTQAGNEIDVFFGELTFTEPPACSGIGFPHLTVEILVNGERITREFLDTIPGETLTVPILEERPYFFEPGTATPRAASARIHDDCDGAGEEYTLDSVQVNAVAIR